MDLPNSETSLNLSKKLPWNTLRAQHSNLAEPREIQYEEEKTIYELIKNIKTPLRKPGKKIYNDSGKAHVKQLTKAEEKQSQIKAGSFNSSKNNLKVANHPKREPPVLSLPRVLKLRKQKSIWNLTGYHYKIIGDTACIQGNSDGNEGDLSAEWIIQGQVQSRLINIKIRKFKRSAEKLFCYLCSVIPTFNPNSKFAILWDIAVIAFAFCRIYLLSIEKAFVADFSSNDFDLVVFLVFLVNIPIKLNTKSFQNGKQVTNRKQILICFTRKNFLSDALPCLALVIFLISKKYVYLNELNLFLLGKILNASEIGRKVKGLLINAEKIERVYILFILLLQVFSIAHLTACVWHYIGYFMNDRYPNEKNWLKLESIDDCLWQVKYLHSIHWGFSTLLLVGSVDKAPTNDLERIFNILALLIGFGVSCYCLSFLHETIIKNDRKTALLNDQINKGALMIKDIKLPLETQVKVKNYLEFYFRKDQKKDSERENFIMSKLPLSLRNEIIFKTRLQYLKSIPVFKVFSDDIIFELAACMKKICFCPEEFVYRVNGIKTKTQDFEMSKRILPFYTKAEDKEEPNLYIVQEGKLSMVSENGRKKSPVIWRYYKKDEYFGVEEVFTGLPRSYGIVSNEFSSLFQISREAIIRVLKKHPYEYEKFCQVKDLDFLYNKRSQYEIDCPSCGLNDHTVSSCKFLKYEPSRFKVVLNHLEKNRKFNKTFKRKHFQSNALINKNYNAVSLNDFFIFNHEDEDFKDLLLLYSVSTIKEWPTSRDSFDLPDHEENNELKENMYSEIEFASHKSRSLKSKYSSMHFKSFSRKISNTLLQSDISKEVFSSKSIKPDKGRAPESSQLKVPAVAQTEVREREKDWSDTVPQTEKIKSFQFYFPRNNIENLLVKKTKNKETNKK